jgi:branched-chain amino acid transport system substrate-binding protein
MKKPAIVYMEDDWGASYRDSVTSYLAEKGFQQPSSHGITAGTREFRSQLEKLKQESPDTLFLLLYAKEGATFMQQLRQLGIQAVVYGSDNISSAEFLTAGNDVTEGVRVAMPAPVQGQLFDKFSKEYLAKFGESPDANVIKSYDAMKLVCAAISAVGPDPSEIKKYLRSAEFRFEGVSGPIKFDEHGDLVSQQYTRMAYKGGKLVPFQ